MRRQTLKQKRAEIARLAKVREREEAVEIATRKKIERERDLELVSQFCALIEGVQLPDDVFLTAGRFIANQACFSQFNVGLLRRVRDSIKRLGKS